MVGADKYKKILVDRGGNMLVVRYLFIDHSAPFPPLLLFLLTVLENWMEQAM